jgi:hypothetical protein
VRSQLLAAHAPITGAQRSSTRAFAGGGRLTAYETRPYDGSRPYERPICATSAPGRLIDARLVRAELVRLRAPHPGNHVLHARRIPSTVSGGR